MSTQHASLNQARHIARRRAGDQGHALDRFQRFSTGVGSSYYAAKCSLCHVVTYVWHQHDAWQWDQLEPCRGQQQVLPGLD